MDSSAKNENYVNNVSSSCCSKPVRLSLVFGKQMKILLMKTESFLTLHRQWRIYHVQGPERTLLIVHATSVFHPYFYEVTRILCVQGKLKYQLYSTIYSLQCQVSKTSYWFGTTWGWEINDRIILFWGELSY